MTGDMGVSASLKESLLQISATAHNENLSSSEKAKKLSELAGPALIMLDDIIGDVGGTRRDLLNEFKSMIQSGKWATLPEPRDINLTLEKINKITAAINDVKEKMVVDSTELFRELLEIMREMMLENRFSQTVSHGLDVNAAEAAKNTRALANQKQLSSDLASSIAQGIGGLVSGIGSIVSLKGAISAAGKAKSATELAGGVSNVGRKPVKTLDELEAAAGKAKDNLDSVKSKIADLRAELVELKKVRTHRALNAKETRSLNLLENQVGAKGVLIDKKNFLETKFYQAKKDHATRFNDVEVLRKGGDASIAKVNALQGIFGGISSLTNSIGGVASAIEKNESMGYQVKVDQHNINKEVSQKMYQTAADSASTAREALRSAVGMMSAIEQSYANMSSQLARNSV